MKTNDVYLKNCEYDLKPILYGHEKCAPLHQPEALIKDFYLIHYVANGKGIFYRNNIAYPVSAGQIFIIIPGVITTYCADKNDPWQYIWIGFVGKTGEMLRSLPPVLNIRTDVFYNIMNHNKSLEPSELYMTAQLYALFSDLFKLTKEAKKDYVFMTKNYIRSHYNGKITVEGISDYFNISRQYLSRIFKQETGHTIQEHLISTRIKHAKRMLVKGISPSQVAELCGFSDLYSFSHCFSKRVGMSPKSYTNKKVR